MNQDFLHGLLKQYLFRDFKKIGKVKFVNMRILIDPHLDNCIGDLFSKCAHLNRQALVYSQSFDLLNLVDEGQKPLEEPYPFSN